MQAAGCHAWQHLRAAPCAPCQRIAGLVPSVVRWRPSECCLETSIVCAPSTDCRRCAQRATPVPLHRRFVAGALDRGRSSGFRRVALDERRAPDHVKRFAGRDDMDRDGWRTARISSGCPCTGQRCPRPRMRARRSAALQGPRSTARLSLGRVTCRVRRPAWNACPPRARALRRRRHGATRSLGAMFTGPLSCTGLGVQAIGKTCFPGAVPGSHRRPARPAPCAAGSPRATHREIQVVPTGTGTSAAARLAGPVALARLHC